MDYIIPSKKMTYISKLNVIPEINIGAEYLVFVSSRSLKTREKNTNWDNLDGSNLKKYTNWDELSCLSLYIFL